MVKLVEKLSLILNQLKNFRMKTRIVASDEELSFYDLVKLVKGFH